jgi:predicted permease
VEVEVSLLVEYVPYCLRRLWRSPGFTATVVLTLALGIGGTTAIFSLIHAVLLQPLPVPRPDALYRIGDNPFGGITGGLEDNFGTFSFDLYQYFRDHTPEFAELAAVQSDNRRVSVRRAAAESVEPFFGEFVSGNYFAMLGLSPAEGRLLAPADDQAGAAPVAVLSFEAWQEKYGLDPAAVGSTVLVNGHAVLVVGVAARGFFGATLRPDPPDIWLPLATERLMNGTNSVLDQRTLHWLFVLGRVHEGVDPAALDARIKVELRQWLADVGPGLPAELRARLARQTVHVVPAGAGIVSVRAIRTVYATGLRLLMTISAFVLLIVSANIANLVLVRGLESRREGAVRVALGAARSRLVAEALVESVLLALMGGLLGLAVANAAQPVMLRLAFTNATYVPIATHLETSVLVFALGVSLATGLAFGVVPAWIGSRVDPAGSLRASGRTTSASGRRTQHVLVVLQASLALSLLVASGLLARSLVNLQGQNLGFEAAARLAVRFDPNLAGYQPEQLDALTRALEDRLLKVPGVLDVAFASYAPLSGASWSTDIAIPGRDIRFASPAEWVAWDRVGPSYFRVIGTPVLRGREIGTEDTHLTRPVAVVNQTFVDRYFPGQEVLGQHFGTSGPASARDYEIVGVVADTKYFNPREAVRPMFFLAMTQPLHFSDPDDEAFERQSMYPNDVILRLAPGGRSVEPLVRQAFSTVDPNLVVIRALTLGAHLKRTLGQQTLVARLAVVYGLFALALASIGLYGVISYAVEQRTREIGIRMALGADRVTVVRQVLAEATRLSGAGLVLGVPLAMLLGRVLDSILYCVSRYDLAILVVAASVLGLCTVLAALLPARRAAAIGPLRALRSE